MLALSDHLVDCHFYYLQKGSRLAAYNCKCTKFPTPHLRAPMAQWIIELTGGTYGTVPSPPKDYRHPSNQLDAFSMHMYFCANVVQ